MAVERSPVISKTMSQQSDEFEDVEDLEQLDPITPGTSRPPNQNNDDEADDASQDDDRVSYSDLLKAFNETRDELNRQRHVIQTLNASLAKLEGNDPGRVSSSQQQ